MKTIFLIAGARPNFMKIAPIYKESWKYEGSTCKLVHTGQHYDYGMSQAFFDDLELPEPHFFLNAGSGSHAVQTAKIMVAFENLCHKESPDLAIVVGDVNSTLACSVVAKKLLIKVAHVEAGLRSFDLTMPEEINRIVTDSISDYFFVTEESGVKNLLDEGKSKDNIFFVGNVMIDNLLYQVQKLNHMDKGTLWSTPIKERFSNYGVVTLHRPSNVDDKERLEEILNALSVVSEHLPLVFPVHPRTRKNIEKFNIKLNSSVVTSRPLSYIDFLYLWKDARIVFTDSGGIQEETTALGIPCLTLRENTERPITVFKGTNIVVGTSPLRIINEAKKILEGKNKKGRKPKLWDGKASERIWRVLSAARH